MKVKLFYITRKKQWSDRNYLEVSQKEWNDYVADDQSLEHTTIVGDGNFYLWKGLSKMNPPLIDWRSGMLCSNCPDKALLGKMILIAKDLRATVFDMDGIEYSSIDDIPYDFDREIDQQLEKKNGCLQELLSFPPRCLHDFGIVDCDTSDVFRGGHGELLNIGYQVKCKTCDSKSFIVKGYYWLNDYYKKEYFVAPISLKCCSCGREKVVFHPGVHGYDPEACSFSHTDFSKEKGTRLADFQCEKCRHDSFEVNIWFSYSDDLFEADFDDFAGRKQDLFSWIIFEGKCLYCKQSAPITDFECA